MNKHFVTFFLCLTVLFVNGQSIDPLKTKDFKAQEKWVDSIMSSMTVDEKIGQLFMVAAYSNKNEKHKQEILKLIKEYHIGALIFFQDDPIKQAQLTNIYQEESSIPLLIGIDAEWGLNMRLKNTFRYPWNMTLGAIKNEKSIETFGEQLGEHCNRLGIHMNFAPVVDVNTNPDNPIIGNRSFGENPMNVAEKSIAFTKGLQSKHVLASAKHFPGHGDTATDSHLTLPTITFSKERIEEVELYPYRKNFDTGVAGVMVAHLSVPSLEPNKNLPSSLSYNIVTKLLKQEMGFNGLIITDAMNMKASANYNSSAEINLAAILAGNDLLDVPLEIPATVKRFKEALSKGELTIDRLDESVYKILKTKYWVGLHQYEPIAIDGLLEDLNTVENKVLHRSLVKQSITLVKNENITPIKSLDKQRIAYVKLGTSDHEDFLRTLRYYTQIDEVKLTNVTQINKQLSSYDIVIVGVHKSNANPWKSYKLTKEELVYIDLISKNNKTILNVFTSPYSLLEVVDFSQLETIMVSYQNSKAAQELSAQMIFGGVSVSGKLPVSIRSEFKEGTGIYQAAIKRLSYGIPEEVDMDSQKLNRIDSIMKVVIDEEMAPGGQVLVARKGKVIFNKGYGFQTYQKKKPITTDAIYDLASLTKILGGLPMVMKAYEDKKFNLEMRLDTLFPDLKDSNKADITVKRALSHYGRIYPWIPFHVETLDTMDQQPLPEFYRSKKSEDFPIQVSENLFLNKTFNDTIYKRIAESDLLKKNKYRYSGLIFFLYKKFIEEEYGEGLDELDQKYFYGPIGATTLMYNPLKKFDRSRIVPSEIDNYFRHDTLRGYVHDMGAAVLGGVNGNAGLFSNANDVAKMMQLYLQKGVYGEYRLLDSTTINTFNKRYYLNQGVRRGLGFDKPQLDPEIHSTCGCMSNMSFGHSGFTGTYTWADPETELIYVFLSNRTYPTMDNNLLGKKNIRTIIQQYIVDSLVIE